MMNEPGVADVGNLAILRYPPLLSGGAWATGGTGAQAFECGANVAIAPDEIPELVDDPSLLTVG
jgi:hypothetical protein